MSPSLLLPLLLSLGVVSSLPEVVYNPDSVTLTPGESSNFTLHSDPSINVTVTLFFNSSSSFSSVNSVVLPSNESVAVEVTALQPVNEEFFEVASCEVDGDPTSECPLDLTASFARVRIIHSHVLDVIVIIVGWAYFFAWSISFYPQIILNFQRKSVAGLNFDFVLLNTIGFASYTIYNCLIYFDPAVQAEYKAKYPRSPIPVLLNDVVFAAHAFLACVVTGLQAIFMERENQRVSRVCIGYSIILVLFGVVTSILAGVNAMQLLRFVDCLSYIKLAVTLSKYFPQAIFNWRRKSTIGWSIGNILLDFTGGSLDLLQVALQGYNVDNFSAIIGNPVKFSLGLVSIVFDIVFMIQHYILYRDAEMKGKKVIFEVVDARYEGIVNEAGPAPEEGREGEEDDNNSTDALHL